MPERELINGRYRLISVIGQGAMGAVWRGRDEMLGRDVAIKKIILSADLDEDEHAELKALAMREARATAALNHPGVITVFDVIEHDQAPVIVMELIEGESLAEILRTNVRLPWKRVAEIGAAMADALREAHAAGIVHRDLKPANVLVAGRRVVITDFGIAQRSGELTAADPGDVTGTPAFMAPEQAENAAASPAADLWALGATLFNATEGVPPFQGPDYASVLLLLLSQDPPRPRNAGPLTPLITALLSRDPARRPSAEPVTEELATILRDGTTVPVSPASAPMPSVPNAAAPPLGFPAKNTGSAAAPGIPRASGNRPNRSQAPPLMPLRYSTRSNARRGILVGLSAVGLIAALVSAFVGIARLDARRWSHPAPAGGVAARKTGPALTGSMAFSPDGDMLAVGEALPNGPANFVEMLNAPDHVRLGTIALGELYPVSLVFSSDGGRLAVGGLDGSIDVWDVATRTRIAEMSVVPTDFVEDDVFGLQFSKDGKSLFICDDADQYGKWKISHDEMTLTFISGYREKCRALSPDGRTFTDLDSSYGELKLWKHVGGHLKSTLLAAPFQSFTAAVSNDVFSPDGKTLAITRYDPKSIDGHSGPGVVEIWDVASHTRLVSHDITLYKGGGLAFSRDGRTLATAESTGDVTLWKLGGYQAGKKISGQSRTGPDSLAFSGDLLAVGGADGLIRLYDLNTDRLVMSWPAGGG